MISKTPNLSVLIITLNEEVHMRELLTELTFADEIIIVDSYSTDKTKEIATSFPNVKFIEHPFENYTSQRNFAIDQAKNNWILFMDADERLTPGFKQEVIDLISQNPKHSAYLVHRIFMFQDQVLRFSGWQTDKIFRLFNKQNARYTDERLVHEKLKINGKIGLMKHKIIHYSYSNYDDYKAKMISYGNLKALEAKIKNKKPSLLISVLHPIYTFLYNYIIRLGILDGKKGIIICYLNAMSVKVRYKELKKLMQVESQSVGIKP